MFRRAIVTLSTGCIIAATASAAAAGDNVHVPLIGPDGNFACDTGEVFAGGEQQAGAVLLHGTTDRVSAVVQLRNARPNTRYMVRLIQVSEDGSDCHVGAVPVITNSHGHGTLRLSEARQADAFALNVSVNRGHSNGAPHFVGSHPLQLDDA